jgi:hypothetical protein
MQSYKKTHFEELVDHIIEWIFEVNITASKNHRFYVAGYSLSSDVRREAIPQIT